MSQTFLQPKFVGSKDKVLKFNNSLQLQAVNLEIVGIKPQVLVTTPEASVTASCSSVTITRSTDSYYIATFDLPFTGDWTFTDGINSAVLTVDIIKQYSLTLTPVTNPSFYVGQDEYEFERDMTWLSWINSPYNTAGYMTTRNYVYRDPITRAASYYILTSENSPSSTVYVNVNDLIQSGYTYIETYEPLPIEPLAPSNYPDQPV